VGFPSRANPNVSADGATEAKDIGVITPYRASLILFMPRIC
jgi:hypothetical protein